MLLKVTDAPSIISAIGVAAPAISETTLSIACGSFMLSATAKIPATEPIISGFVAIPFRIFRRSILVLLKTSSVITARMFYIGTITVTSTAVIPSLPSPKMFSTIGIPISTKLLR